MSKLNEKILSKNMFPLTFGGEHSISSGAVQAFVNEQPDVMLIQLDAHADLREEWLGSRHSHACAMRRCLEVLPSKQIFQLGIRSGTQAEFKELQEEKRRYRSPDRQGGGMDMGY